MIIRRIRPGDGSLLRDVRLRALHIDPDAFGARYKETLSRSDDVWEEAVVAAATGEEQFLAVAEGKVRFVGMVGAYTSGDEPDIRNLYGLWVAPESRTERVGSRLVAAVVD